MRFKYFMILLPLLLCLSVSCSKKTPSPDEYESDGSKPAEAAPEEIEGSDYYYDFDDIIVPREMKMDVDDTFVTETPQSKSGVMVFSGKVEIKSLTNYFINNMAKDNWNMVCAFKSKRTILIFEKPQRYCVINITDGYSTLLEIWVSPKEGGYSVQ